MACERHSGHDFMPVILVDVGLGLLAGLIGFVVTLRWPTLDPANPSVAPQSVAAGVAEHPRLEAALRKRFDPAGITGGLLTAAAIAATTLAVLFGILAVLIRSSGAVKRLDMHAARWGATHASERSTTLLRDVSLLGGTQWGLAILVIVAVLLALHVRRRFGQSLERLVIDEEHA